MTRTYAEVIAEAREMNIHYAGLNALELENRIKSKKEKSGIYAASHIDPDMKMNELLKIAKDLGIKTDYSIQHQQLVNKINNHINKNAVVLQP